MKDIKCHFCEEDLQLGENKSHTYYIMPCRTCLEDEYESGQDEGRDEGYDDGYRDGFDEGHESGMNEASCEE